VNTIAKWVAENRWLAWGGVFIVAILSGWATSELVRDIREQERLSVLQTEARRGGIEIMSQTLNGNVMGALGLLGIIDPEIKREARGNVSLRDFEMSNRGKTLRVSAANLANLESIGRSFGAEGTFLVKHDGWIGAGWDAAGKPSSGMNVKFRPYYQMAMQGLENVYAAVSQARGERMLYFSAPVYAQNTSGTDAIGAVVARTGLLKIDDLLRDKADIALLLSPQDVVFASNKAEWVTHVAGKVTPERLKAIRDLKQFGDLFVSKAPLPLPVSIDAGIHVHDGKPMAVAQAKVQWNDPMGDWTLVLMEDLSRSIPRAERLKLALLTGVIVLVLGSLALRLLRSQHAQRLAAEQLNAHALAQRRLVENKAVLAGSALRMQQARNLTDLAKVFLQECHRQFDAMQGTVYVADPASGALTLAGCHACADSPPQSIAPGEGLLGQCALERRLLLLGAEGHSPFVLRSGLGETTPVALMIVPVLTGDTLQGVAELALLHRPDPDEQARLEEFAGLLAMNIDIMYRREHLTAPSVADSVEHHVMEGRP